MLRAFALRPSPAKPAPPDLSFWNLPEVVGTVENVARAM
jgi:hypothetical protein